MHPKDAEGIANSVDPDQTVCPGLSVRKLRKITVLYSFQKLHNFVQLEACVVYALICHRRFKAYIILHVVSFIWEIIICIV